jgi:hypothetical protein
VVEGVREPAAMVKLDDTTLEKRSASARAVPSK